MNRVFRVRIKKTDEVHLSSGIVLGDKLRLLCDQTAARSSYLITDRDVTCAICAEHPFAKEQKA